MASGLTAAGGWATTRALAADIKLAHSVFALPFALLAACMARAADGSGRTFAGQLALVAACMVAARTWAMLVNRLADRRIDARNERTARRALASGRVSVRAGAIAAGASAAAFIACAWAFDFCFGNPWPVRLAVPVLAWIAFYSLAKRFTLLCHVILGAALATSPIAAAIAVRPSSLGDTPALWLIAGMVTCWVAGFDVIYALQDVDIDRRDGLRSIPAALGWRGAAAVSRVLHALAGAFLVMAWRADARFGAIFALGVSATLGLLVVEHLVLARRGHAGLEMSFFTINGVVSCVLGVSGIIDCWTRSAG